MVTVEFSWTKLGPLLGVSDLHNHLEFSWTRIRFGSVLAWPLVRFGSVSDPFWRGHGSVSDPFQIRFGMAIHEVRIRFGSVWDPAHRIRFGSGSGSVFSWKIDPPQRKFNKNMIRSAKIILELKMCVTLVWTKFCTFCLAYTQFSAQLLKWWLVLYSLWSLASYSPMPPSTGLVSSPWVPGLCLVSGPWVPAFCWLAANRQSYFSTPWILMKMF